MDKQQLNLDGKTVLLMSNFQSNHTGNFINSLLELAEKGKKKYNMSFVFLFPLRDDGTECDWTEYIRSFGWEVILFNEKQPVEITEKFLFDTIDNKHIDLLHNHFNLLNQICLWNKELHSKVKILYHDHMGYSVESSIKSQIKKQVKLSKRYRKYGIGVISVMKKKYRGYFFAKKRWYIPNGITYKRNVNYSMSREECRSVLGIRDNEKLCLVLGWDIYIKGVDIAIKAVHSARERGHSITLGLVGFGANPSDEQINQIKDIIDFDPRQEGVRFFDSWEDMYALHRAADVFLSASRTEAFSYAILEAISQNVPVVASDISGTRWCLKYSKAFKFPSENVEECAKAIIQASELRNEPSNCKEITDKFNIDVWCDRVLSVYQKMLE